MEPALVPDGRHLGAVEERDGGRVAAVGTSWRFRGRSLGSAIGCETVRPRRMVNHGVPALGSMGESRKSWSTWRRPTRRCRGRDQVAGAPLLQSEEDWAPLPALRDRLKAVEEQQALASEKLSIGTKQSVQTDAAPPRRLPGHWAGGGALLFFFLALTSLASRRKLHVRASVHWTSPSRAWSTRCGWYFSAQGFQLLGRSQVEEAPFDTCKRCWKLEEVQPAALPEVDRWQAPEQSCLE